MTESRHTSPTPLPATGPSLREAAALFTSTDRQTRTDVLLFEELALHLVRRAGTADKRAAAAMLAHHPNTPKAVLTAFLRDEIAVAEVVIAEAPFAEADLLAAIATTTPEHRRAIAGRRPLPADVAEALVRVGEREALLVLAANDGAVLDATVEAAIARRARTDGDLARTLGQRPGIRSESLIDLFLILDARGRRRALHALELKALAHLGQHRLLAAPEGLSAADRALVLDAAASGDPARLAAALSPVMSIPLPVARQIVEDPDGDALALTLKAAGLPRETTLAILAAPLTGETRAWPALKRLEDLIDGVSLRAAILLADQWRAGHVPRSRAGLQSPQVEPRPVRPESSRAGAAGSPAARDARQSG